MWHDNETDTDLLGIDLLVDGLVVALTEPRLLPLTVGVLGDWGSGKSSLMRIAKVELERLSNDEGRYVCVWFSPWQYEGYEDVKVALMTLVLDSLGAVVPEGDDADRLSALRRFVSHLGRPARAVTRSALAAVPAATVLAAGAIDPNLAPAMPAISAATGALSQEAAAAVAEKPEDGGPEDDEMPTDIVGFRKSFAELVESVEDLRAVVVFIDDLDRCLPETVVDTFEAIRLFLNTPKSAYVVAAHQKVVESAIDSRYPDLRREDGTGIGAVYLEKMLQIKVSIPTLSAPEAQTYVNLLLAELHLAADQFETVRSAVAEARRKNVLSVPLTRGTAESMVDDAPAEFLAALDWAANIASALGTGLRGNPRQLKRFLNSLLLKTRTAERRQVSLRPAVLAKLMALEDQHIADFQKIFDWQILSDGPIPELAMAEATVLPRPETGAPATEAEESGDPGPTLEGEHGAAPAEVTAWAEKPHVRRWLRLEPPLGEIDLGPYFTYSRDKLSIGVSGSRLPAALQTLLVQAGADVKALRRTAIGGIAALEADDQAILLHAMAEALAANPSSHIFETLLELAEQEPVAVSSVCSVLSDVPTSALTPARLTTAVRRLTGSEEPVRILLDGWTARGGPVAQTLETTRRAGARRTR